MRYLYLIFFFRMALSPVFAQAPSELSEDDKREIKAEAKKVIETHLSDLLNTVASDAMGEQGRKLIMANSFIPSENQIFDINAIIEDDINPEYTISKKGYSDVKVQRYLENLNLFYTKSEQPSIKISEVNVTEVKNGAEFPFVLVHYKILFSNTHRSKPALKYAPVLRTAELRAEKVDKKWNLLITGIRYFRQPVQETAVSKAPEKSVKPTVTPAVTKNTTDQRVSAQKAKETKKTIEAPKEVKVQPEPVKIEQQVAVVEKPETLVPAAEKKSEAVKPTERSPEIVPQKLNPALKELELKVAKYKKQTALFRVGAGAAVVGAAATFVIVNGAYGDYKKQIDKSNTEFEAWYTADANGSKFGDIDNYKTKPVSLIKFGAPGIYFVGAGIVTAGVLWLLSNSPNQQAKSYKKQLEQKRKQLSMTPQVSGSQRYAGLQIRYQF